MRRAPEGSSVNSETQKERTFRTVKKEKWRPPHQSLIFHEGNIRPDSRVFETWDQPLPTPLAHVQGIEDPRLRCTQHLSFEEDEYDSVEKFSSKLSEYRICWKPQSLGGGQIPFYLEIFVRVRQKGKKRKQKGNIEILIMPSIMSLTLRCEKCKNLIATNIKVNNNTRVSED